MSMPYIPNDDPGDLLEVTKEGYILRYFYKDSQCTKHSTRFRGEYQKIIKYSFKNLTPYHKWRIEDYLNKCGGEIKEIFPVYDYDHDYFGFIDSGEAVLVSERIEKNPEYDPDYWQELYERSLEAIAEAEAEGYRIY